MAQLFANNASGVLVTSVNGAATTLVLSSGHGARFPAPTGGDFFHATFVGLDANGAEASWEVVRCTARTTDQLTVVRAQEGTAATSWNAGTRVELRMTAASLQGKQDREAGKGLSANDFTDALKGKLESAAEATHSHTADQVTGLGVLMYGQAMSRSDKDANGIFTTVQYRRADGSLARQSVLSGGASPEYTTRTETLYDSNGVTVLDTLAFTLTHTDGQLVSEVLA